jgi:hypothetical protein
MKQTVVLAGVLLLLVASLGCTSSNAFDADYAKASAIMARNGAVPPATLLPPTVDLINHTQFELSAFRPQVEKEPDSADKVAMRNFLAGQYALLEMQKQFYLGQEQLSLTDFTRVSCDAQSNIRRAISSLDAAATQSELAEQYFSLFFTNSPKQAAATQIDSNALLSQVQQSRQLFLGLKETAQKYCA